METEETIVSTNGARLFYHLSRRGGGDTVLLMLHGLASNSSRWQEFVEQLQLDQDWDLLRLDLRGHGRSMLRGRIGHDLWADDLQALLAHHGYARAVIVGHSLGAQLALHFASRYRRQCAALILIDPVFPDCQRGRLRRIGAWRPLLWLAIRLVWILNGLGLRQRRFPELDLYRLDRQTRQLLHDEPDRQIASYYARPLSDLRYLPLANYLQDLYALSQVLPRLSDIDLPLLVLLSKGGSLGDLDCNRRHIAELPRAATVMIDADHWPLTERPQQTRAAIEAWCNRLDLDTG